MNEEFKKIIDEDVNKIEIELENGSTNSRYILYKALISKYGKIIDGFSVGLHSLMYDDNGSKQKANLEILRQKLILFKSMDFKNCYSKNENPEITINNTNLLSSTFNISFDEAKKQVEHMTSLTDEEIEEIHNKIDELEAIINSCDRKTKKWDKAKEIIKWVADKGVDVGITLLPLILKLGE